MLKESVPGLEKVISGDIKEGYTILITGSPGTLKTAFAFTVMNGILKKAPNRSGVYVTLEESWNDHLWNMKSFGIVPRPNLNVFDIAKFRSHLKNLNGYSIECKDVIEIIHKSFLTDENAKIDEKKGGEVPLCYTLDSLNALISLCDFNASEKRKFIQELFFTFKENGIISFIIWQQDDENCDEYFLADSVLQLGIDRTKPRNPKRYILIKKMKGVKHKLEEFAIDVTENGLEIISQTI